MDIKPSWITIHGKKGSYRFFPFDKNNVLGEGGMGRVFIGFDNRTGEKVAIKAVFTELAKNENIKARSEFEAHLQFEHPNVIKMLDLCTASDGRIHIVSRFIEGKTLPKYVMEISPDTDRQKSVILLAISALHGLEFLHQQGIVHRDIKPENIMIDHLQNAMIMDLGVAKASSGKRMTKAGIMIGTPHYSAPEQIRGESDNIGPGTDIYAMGITLYELISGSPPFDGHSEYDVMQMQVKKPLPRHPLISDQMFAILKKATEKNRTNRYASAAMLKLALEKVLYPQSFWQRLLTKISNQQNEI